MSGFKALGRGNPRAARALWERLPELVDEELKRSGMRRCCMFLLNRRLNMQGQSAQRVAWL
jgi:hypothetical protein